MNALSRIWTPLKATFTYAKWRSHGRNGVRIREGASSPRPVTPRLRPPGPPASGRTRQEPASHGPGRTSPSALLHGVLDYLGPFTGLGQGTVDKPARGGRWLPVRPRTRRWTACPQRPLTTRRSRIPTRAGSSRPSRAATASRVALRGVRTRPGPGGVGVLLLGRLQEVQDHGERLRAA